MNKSIVNFVLNGFSGWSDDTMDQILNKPAEEANLDDINKLSMKEIVKLFHAAPSPEFTSIKGEYQAEVLSVGKLGFVASFYTHHLFGPGRWQGKGFLPQENSKGYGYNLFSARQSETPVRTRKMDTYIDKSNIDDGDSFHLDYAPHNSFLNSTMHDEIREINPTLYLGLGYMGVGGGPLNPAPFVLYGQSTEWVGLDEE
jgi:hypothetical protein